MSFSFPIEVWSSYVSVLVQGVVGQFEFKKGHRLLHPVAAGGRGVWVEVRPAGGLRLSFTGHLPLMLVPLWRETEKRLVRKMLWVLH